MQVDHIACFTCYKHRDMCKYRRLLHYRLRTADIFKPGTPRINCLFLFGRVNICTYYYYFCRQFISHGLGNIQSVLVHLKCTHYHRYRIILDYLLSTVCMMEFSSFCRFHSHSIGRDYICNCWLYNWVLSCWLRDSLI